jgi:hypothetical protein
VRITTGSQTAPTSGMSSSSSATTTTSGGDRLKR